MDRSESAESELAKAAVDDAIEPRRSQREAEPQNSWSQATLHSIGDGVIATDTAGRSPLSTRRRNFDRLENGTSPRRPLDVRVPN